MKIAIARYHRLAKFVGAILTAMGLGLITVFATLVLTGANPLEGSAISLDGPGLLVLASIGAFALPLGLSLFAEDARTSARLQIAGGALGAMSLLRLAAFLSPDLREALGTTPLVEFFVLGALGALAYFLRPENESAIELRTDVELDVSASRAWQVLGEDFGNLGDWASSLISSSLDREVGVGALRTCDVRAFGPFPPGRIVEELYEFDRDALAFGYSPTSGMPRMFESARSHWSIEVLGPGRCLVKNHAALDLRWWALPFAQLLSRGIRSSVDKFVVDMRARIEPKDDLPSDNERI